MNETTNKEMEEAFDALSPLGDAHLPQDVALLLRDTVQRLYLRELWYASLEEQELPLWLADSPDGELLLRRMLDEDLELDLGQELARASKDWSPDSRWAGLITCFELDAVEQAILQCCISVALSPRLGAVFGAFSGLKDAYGVTASGVARLFGYGHHLPWRSSSPLHRWSLIQERVSPENHQIVLGIPGYLLDWLLGASTLPLELARCTRLHRDETLVALESWPQLPGLSVAETSAPATTPTGVHLSVVDARASIPTGVTLVGVPGSGRASFASAVAAARGMPLLEVLPSPDRGAQRATPLVGLQSLAKLEGWAVAWHVDALREQRQAGTSLEALPLQFLLAEAGDTLPALPCARSLHATMKPLSLSERRSLWRLALPDETAWPDADVDELALRYQATPGDIMRAVSAGADDLDGVVAALQRGQSRRLGQLAQPLPCPFRWTDLVVAPEVQATLEALLYEAKHRWAFWEQEGVRRLFPRGRGLIALLSGPPGTGKTMTAQIVAAELGLELYRIDLSAVVSKYIGETAKNLDRILSQAAEMDVVLFFDEADALFSKRTDTRNSNDRYANMDINYLLQAIESYEGVAFLATNKRGQLEPALLRRLRYIVEFTPPDGTQRLRLWRLVLEEMTSAADVARLEEALALLAREVKITGAQIKNATLAALFIARRLGEMLAPTHLLQGLQRELSKEGHPFGAAQQQALLRQLE